MKRLTRGLTATAIITLGVFAFSGCEKEETTNFDNGLKIVKCWDDLNIEGFNPDEGVFYSYPDNPEILINPETGEAYTCYGVLLEEKPTGEGHVYKNAEGKVIEITCEGKGNNCGRAQLTNQNGDVVKEGIYVHVFDDSGLPTVTYYDFTKLQSN